MIVDLTDPAPTPDPRAPAAPARRRSRWKAAGARAVAVAVLATLGFDAWSYWRDIRPLANLRVVADWVRANRLDEAEPILREHLRRSPRDGDARTELARILARRDDMLGCARQLHEVPDWWPSKPDALFREANAALKADRAADAEAAWLAIVWRDPLHPPASDLFHNSVFELLKLYATQDRWDDAFPVLWHAYDESGTEDRETLLNWRMRSELERVAPAESIVRLAKYVAADPADWQSLRALARAELALNRSSEAEAHFLALLKARPEDGRCWRDYLAMLYERGDRAAWAAALAKVPKAAEAEPEVWRLRGIERQNAGDLAAAAADYRAAIDRNPFVVDYHHRLAMVEERLDHRDLAAEHRRKAAAIREARAQLPAAYYDVLDAQKPGAPAGTDLRALVRRLASVCDAMGYARAAEGWNRLADMPRSAP